jgi:hypothetical protein
MANGFEAFAQNAMALGQQWREQRRERNLAKALQNYDADPQGTIKAVTNIDPTAGYNMRRQFTADQQTTEANRQARFKEALTTATTFLRPAAADPNANPQTLGTAFDSIAPMLATELNMQPNDLATIKQMFVSNPQALLDQTMRVLPAGAALLQGNKPIFTQPLPPKTMAVPPGSAIISVDPSTGKLVAGGGAPAAATPAAAPGGGRTSADQAWAFTAPQEGGYAAHDANGAPVNFGINQSANPGVDVSKLTPDQAKQIFNDKYFAPSGAANMPPALGVLHADTYFINPKRAEQFYQQSGGDPQKYLQLRAAWQDSLVKSNPRKYGKYADAWDNRNVALAKMINSNGGGSAASGAGAPPGAIFYNPKPTTPSGGKGNFPRLLTSDDVAALNAQGNHLDPNMQWQYDRFGQVQPVGGAAAIKSAQDRQKLTNARGIIINNLDRMAGVVKTLAESPGLDRATGEMSYFPSIRGGRAKDFENNLESLKSQVMINVLNNLKAVSPNGSAMGRVTNYEAQNLQRDIANLELSSSPAQMRASLQKVLQFIDQLKEHYNRAYSLDASGGVPQQGGTAAPPRAAIDMLRANPSPQSRQQFDQIFGNGAAKKVLGSQ